MSASESDFAIYEEQVPVPPPIVQQNKRKSTAATASTSSAGARRKLKINPVPNVAAYTEASQSILENRRSASESDFDIYEEQVPVPPPIVQQKKRKSTTATANTSSAGASRKRKNNPVTNVAAYTPASPPIFRNRSTSNTSHVPSYSPSDSSSTRILPAPAPAEHPSTKKAKVDIFSLIESEERTATTPAFLLRSRQLQTLPSTITTRLASGFSRRTVNIEVRGLAEVRVELQMERWAARGGFVRLKCVHDVPHHLLDKVVFLRHGTKIFQYIRDRKPPYRNFTTPGAVLNIARATENSIILQNLDFAASGSYSCEVSLDTPIFTKASTEKQLTVFHPQKHHPRIEFPTRYLSEGETLRANCTTAPALPAPHITWFINGRKMDELSTHSHKYRVGMSERSSRGGLRARDVTSPVVALTHASHVATRPPGCSLRENLVNESAEIEEPTVIRTTSRHRSRKPSKGRDLYITISELHLVATGRLEITCVSTIPEFRNIDDKFADIRNDTVVVDVIRPSTLSQPSANLTETESSASAAERTSLSILPLSLAILYLPNSA